MHYRSFLVALALFAACVGVSAQQATVAVEPSDEDLQAQRLALQTQRDAASARFAAQESACYERFAVNNCLQEVRRLRTATLRDLQNQDMALKALQRTRAASSKVQSQQERLDQRLQEDKERSAQDPIGAAEERLQSQAAKRESHAKTGGTSAPAPAGVGVVKAEVPDAAAQAASRSAYQSKQDEAQKRRQARDQRVREQGTPAASLPIRP